VLLIRNVSSILVNRFTCCRINAVKQRTILTYNPGTFALSTTYRASVVARGAFSSSLSIIEKVRLEQTKICVKSFPQGISGNQASNSVGSRCVHPFGQCPTQRTCHQLESPGLELSNVVQCPREKQSDSSHYYAICTWYKLRPLTIIFARFDGYVRGLGCLALIIYIRYLGLANIMRRSSSGQTTRLYHIVTCDTFWVLLSNLVVIVVGVSEESLLYYVHSMSDNISELLAV